MPHKDPDIQAAIDEARRIVREDKVIAGQRELYARFDKHFPAADPAPDPANPNQPPAPEPADPPDPAPKKKGIWWQDAD
jgi:hypothetical protein